MHSRDKRSPECRVFISSEGPSRSCSHPSMKVQFVSPGPERGARAAGSVPAPLIQFSEYRVSSLATGVAGKWLRRRAENNTPVTSPLGPCPLRARVSVAVSPRLPLCLCFSGRFFCARACTHTPEAALHPPMPKCHLKNKCNNLLRQRPGSRRRSPLQWAAPSSPPARCIGGWGSGGV